MDKFYDYITGRLSVNSAQAAEEYYDVMEKHIKKEEEFKRKPIEQNEQIISQISETNKSIEETKASLTELKNSINKPRIIDWILIALTGAALFVAILQYLK
ncbi:MAG: hypothetical protein IKP66_00905 [Lachnospiraceae bacterium]|nr:hypothetical protein [Lachnospiraceae bacterium]